MPRNILGPIGEGAGDVYRWVTEGQNPITDPGGLIGEDGQTQNPLIGDKLGKYLSVLRQCIGGPYLAWGAGGDGRHNESVAEVLRNGESCSGLFVFAFLQLGITPAFSGTYDAKAALEAGNGEAFDPEKEYPIGTFLVSTSGAEGHMAMVSASGNMLIQALRSDGITENHTIAETTAMGGADLQFEIAGTFDDILGSATTVGSATGEVGEALSGMAEWIAEGIVNGLMRVLKTLYAYVILRPLDFLGGFWWELTRRFLLWAQVYQVIPGDWQLPGADMTDEEYAEETAEPGNIFSEANKKRLYFFMFAFFTYYLAFGRDAEGKPHFDRMAEGASNLFNRDAYGRRTYNNRATARASLRGVTVARRRVKATSRRQVTGESERKESAPSGTRRSSGNRKRDPGTGRFRKRAPEKETANAQRQGETEEKQNRATREGEAANVQRRQREN